MDLVPVDALVVAFDPRGSRRRHGGEHGGGAPAFSALIPACARLLGELASPVEDAGGGLLDQVSDVIAFGEHAVIEGPADRDDVEGLVERQGEDRGRVSERGFDLGFLPADFRRFAARCQAEFDKVRNEG